MNSELKLVIFDEKKLLQGLLKLLDEQYELILSNDVVKLDKMATTLEEISRSLATIEIKRRNIVKGKDLKVVIEESKDVHIKEVYEEIKILLNNLELQKETNKTLIKQRLFFANKMINVIRPSKSTGTYNSYGKVVK